MRGRWCHLLGVVSRAPYWVYAFVMGASVVGCDATSGSSGALAGSIPGLVAALGALAQAYKVGAQSKAAQEEADARVAATLAKAYDDKAADLATARSLAEEALATSREAREAAEACEKREAAARAVAAQRELDLERQLAEIRAEARASIAAPRPA